LLVSFCLFTLLLFHSYMSVPSSVHLTYTTLPTYLISIIPDPGIWIRILTRNADPDTETGGKMLTNFNDSPRVFSKIKASHPGLYLTRYS
jgi:hypothetical protein